MKRTLLTIVLTALVTLVLVVLVGTAIAESGAIDVSATADHAPGEEWLLSTVSDRSIDRRVEAALEAGEIVPPGEVTQAMLRTGAEHYAEMCVVCHGAPGVERGEIGAGLKPKGPDLAHSAREMDEAEIYWIVGHGIRHTGMPAFGPTHSRDELWAITAFVESLADLSPEGYRSWTAAAGGEHEHGEEAEHEHAHQH